jgi:hypothetical protein
MEQTALISVASFLLGAFLTAMGFIFGFSNKISVMAHDMTELKIDFKKHIDAVQPVCPLHMEMQIKATTRENKISELQHEIVDLKRQINQQERA